MMTAEIVLVLLTAASAVCTGSEMEWSRWRKSLLNDVTFTSDVLFTSSGYSRSTCAGRCARTSQCVTFTFSPQSRTCQGHSARMSTGSASISAPGSVTFEMMNSSGNWTYKPCTSNADCRALNSECFKSECLCTPGYYYSNSNNYCVAQCNPEDLQSTFLRYPQSRMYPHSGSSAGYMGIEACHANCASKSWCVVIEYHNMNRCIQQPDTALDNPGSWDPNFNWDPTNFYQRTCI